MRKYTLIALEKCGNEKARDEGKEGLEYQD